MGKGVTPVTKRIILLDVAIGKCIRYLTKIKNRKRFLDSDTNFVIDSIAITDKDPNLINDFDQSIKMQYNAIQDDTSTSQWSVRLETNNESIKYKIDTGAQVNVLPKHLFKKLSPPPKLKSTPVNPTLPGRFWYLHSLGGRAKKCPPSIFSLFLKLCQPNLVRGNNVQK